MVTTRDTGADWPDRWDSAFDKAWEGEPRSYVEQGLGSAHRCQTERL